jgi:prophage regulatory protein
MLFTMELELSHNVFLRINEIKARTGLSRSTIWRLERDGLFPARKRLSKRAVGWSSSEIAVWLESRAQVHVTVSDTRPSGR